MSKRAVLRLEGNLEQGFEVTLEISDRNFPAFTEASGSLPSALILIDHLESWQHCYRQNSGNTRIALEKVEVRLGTIAQREDCRNRAKQLQKSLQSWLAMPTFQVIEQRLRETLATHESIEVLLRTRDQRLHRLPWHSWDFIERYPHAELVISSPPEQIQSLVKTINRVRILAILGDRRGIDIETDRRLLEALPQAEVTFLVEPSRQITYENLWSQPWDILFFAGHSCTEDHQGRINLNPEEGLTLEELKYALRRAIGQGLQLAIFNSCDGLGLAYALEQLHIPQLIVMREPVPDRVAQSFLKEFLATFSTGESLPASVRQAREWLQGMEGEFLCASWLPVLFQNPAMAPLTWQQLGGSSIPIAGGERSPSEVKNSTVLAKSRRQLSLRGVFAIALAVTTLVVGVRWLGGWEIPELWVYDRIRQVQPSGTVEPRLLMIVADDQDVKAYGDPLSDRTVHDILKKIEKYQPRVIGLDIFRNSPTQKGWQELVKYLQQNKSIIAICQVGEVDGTINPELAKAPPPQLSPEQLSYADGLLPDPDGVVRRYAIAMDQRDGSACKTQSSLAFQIVQHYFHPNIQATYQPEKGLLLTLSKPGKTAQTALIPPISETLGGYQRSPDDMAGVQLMIDYHKVESLVQKISITALLEGNDQDLRQLIRSDRAVLIGYTSGKEDMHPTPLGNVYGVQIHAQVISQLFNLMLRQPQTLSALPDWGEVLWIGLWGIIAGLMAASIPSPWRSVTLFAELLVLGISAFLGFLFSIWVVIIPATISIVLVTLIVYSLRFKLEKPPNRQSGL